MLEPPVGEVLPSRGIRPGRQHVHPATADGSDVEVVVSPTSDRLQLLEPFPAWDGSDYLGLPVLMKAQGKCTTDHISAAGPWLKYRGHLENISGNLFLGVVNAFTDAVGEGKDQIDGATRHVPRHRQALQRSGRRMVRGRRPELRRGLVREHAAMEPRFRNGRVIFARSFARIHETNAKKQGLVPLTFADPATYDPIGEDDRINVLGLPPVPGQTGAMPDRQARRHDRRLRVQPHVQRRAGRVVPGRLGAQHRPPQGGGGRGRSTADTVDDMDLITALRTTGSARELHREPRRPRHRRRASSTTPGSPRAAATVSRGGSRS